MSKLVIILFLTFFCHSVIGQKFVFIEGGKMRPSEFYIDTVINTDLKIKNRIVFKYLDSFYKDSLNIKKYLGSKYDKISKDTNEYFFVANLTDTIIKIKRQGMHLVGQELARYENFGLKPFSFYCYKKCTAGLDFGDFELKPKQILIIRNQIKRIKPLIIGTPNAIANILLSDNVVLKSSSYQKSIGNIFFYIDKNIEEDFNYARRMKLIAFDW
ncbi:MAG: hypothetical protein ACOVO1_05100 [Chitinophagaceae bacterium]